PVPSAPPPAAEAAPAPVPSAPPPAPVPSAPPPAPVPSAPPPAPEPAAAAPAPAAPEPPPAASAPAPAVAAPVSAPVAPPPVSKPVVNIEELIAKAQKQEQAKRYNEYVKTLVELAEAVEEPVEKIDYYSKAADLYTTKFSNAAEAVKCYEAILAL